ncbi:DUF3298 and DUF4163 domain-containing protein [Alteribacter populi]|uniref:DUF3298 and DUF4163 domain-containing protein n=1 Tax=Alteribacter populi TaxID=2011011 RepID=UPI000BBB07D9|nr:DUF3298 and DUF4163 domain-containing protein [Alteribacter populi]
MSSQFQLPVGVKSCVYHSGKVTLFYPQVRKLVDPHVQATINDRIYRTVTEIYRDQIQSQTGTLDEMLGNFEIKTNERGYFSIILSNYTYSYPMAHGLTLAKGLTFDTNTGNLYSLSQLFKPNSEYVKVLSKQVSAQIKDRELPLLNGFTSIKPEQDFYLADKALVLFFQLYDITPYYVGFPMFPISIYTLQSLVSDVSPLAKLSIDLV